MMFINLMLIMPTSCFFVCLFVGWLVSEVILFMRIPLSSSHLWRCSSNPGLSIEKTFQLTRADKDLLLKQEFDVQVDDQLMQ